MATELHLKCSERDERLGGSTPSASVNFRGCTRQHRYLAASHKAWQSLNSDVPGDKETTKPRRNSGLCCIITKKKNEEHSNMSPTAMPTREVTGPSVNTQLAFEQLLAQTVQAREEIRHKSYSIMLALSMLAGEAQEKK